MPGKSLGFIGGGRITRIMLGGLKRAGGLPGDIVVSDRDDAVLDRLKKEFPEVHATKDNGEAALQEAVFLALHPPALKEVLSTIRDVIRAEMLVISLAPKITIRDLSMGLGGHKKIARVIPNAPSIVNEGYNPLAFSQELPENDKNWLSSFLRNLGECPEVSEGKLEAYAVLTAMGPTYFWFQLYELHWIAASFGLSDGEIKGGIEKMLAGSLAAMYRSGLSPKEVMDLVPVRPLEEMEEYVKEEYGKLVSLYKKLRP